MNVRRNPPMPAIRRPSGLLMQWHLTDRCNLRCSHCYQQGYTDAGLDFAAWEKILDRFRAFIAARPDAPALRGHVTVTGGEPFAHPGLPRLIERLHAERQHYSFALLSNGTLIDDALARRLAAWQPAFVQVSLDGGEATHDRIRGAGNFHRACDGLRHLVRHGVRTMISFTAQRSNYREFPEVARIGRGIGVSRVWADRMIPDEASQHEESLSAEETREFCLLMQEARAGAQGSTTEISMKRALQFLVSDDASYRCTAGDTLIAVMPNGDVYPCRRLPLRAGNLLESPLEEIYDGALFRELRGIGCETPPPEACRPCAFAAVCRGGLRCLSHALRGDVRAADPGCWLTDDY